MPPKTHTWQQDVIQKERNIYNNVNEHNSCDTHLLFVYIQKVSFPADQMEYGTHNHYWYTQCPNLQKIHDECQILHNMVIS